MTAKTTLSILTILSLIVCVIFLVQAIWLGLFFAVMVAAFWGACLMEETKQS